MTLFSIAIRDDGEVLTSQVAPHQGDDCDGLVYRAKNEEGHDVFLFFVEAINEDNATMYALDVFNGGEYVAIDPMWQPGSVWPDTADDDLHEQARLQIYSEQAHRGYITTVPTHQRTNPFIDHFGDKIMWAYMRDIESRCIEQWTGDVKLAKEIRRRQEEQQRQQTDRNHAAAVLPLGGSAKPQQLFLDFG